MDTQFGGIENSSGIEGTDPTFVDGWDGIYTEGVI